MFFVVMPIIEQQKAIVFPGAGFASVVIRGLT